MAEKINEYGDRFKPTDDGHGVDIASQRQDELDRASLDFIRASKKPVTAIDLGGGFGAHAARMAQAGADVLMIDIADMRDENFRKTAEAGKLRFLQRDMAALSASDLPADIDVLYSQRTIHYLPYDQAKTALTTIFNRMAPDSAVFISAAGWDTEYGKTYPNRDKPVEERFNFVAPDMQEKHGITHKIVTYKEEDLAKLLEDTGFSGVSVTRSTFGNIKASARKIR